MGDFGPVYDDFGVPMGEPPRPVTLRDALAAAMQYACARLNAHITTPADGPMRSYHDLIDVAVSDPAFRAALTEAVAEALEPFDVIDYRVDPHGDIMGITAGAAIVARMLP